MEILQDPTIYKTGVQIRGDGLKLLRDFPEAFPTGLTSLLELSHLARRVDPIGTGPGAHLISLANLGRAYMGREIDKDSGVRKGDWTKRLDAKQIDCGLSLFRSARG